MDLTREGPRVAGHGADWEMLWQGHRPRGRPFQPAASGHPPWSTRGGRAAAGSTWRWERLAPRRPRLLSLCLRTMPTLGMSFASPTTAGQLCGHCRHVCPPVPGRGHNMSPAEPACRQLLPSGSCLCVCLGGWSAGTASALPGCGMHVFLVVWTDNFVLKGVARGLENGFWD